MVLYPWATITSKIVVWYTLMKSSCEILHNPEVFQSCFRSFYGRNSSCEEATKGTFPFLCRLCNSKAFLCEKTCFCFFPLPVVGMCPVCCICKLFILSTIGKVLNRKYRYPHSSFLPCKSSGSVPLGLVIPILILKTAQPKMKHVPAHRGGLQIYEAAA